MSARNCLCSDPDYCQRYMSGGRKLANTMARIAAGRPLPRGVTPPPGHPDYTPAAPTDREGGPTDG